MTVKVSNLDFYYGDRKILDNINFDVGNKEFVSILGPNGVGKTTLLKCLCNIHRPNKGSIFVDEKDILPLHPADMAKFVAYVPQRASATHSTVFDTLLIGRKPHMTWGSSERDVDIVYDVLESMELEDLSMEFADEISGGELQKVQIARALAQEPRLLVLDEPTNNLDLSNQHSVLKLISDQCKMRDMTVIMTMHDINLSLYYSDKFLLLEHGKIADYGGSDVITPENILRVYGVENTATYVDGQKIIVPKKLQ